MIFLSKIFKRLFTRCFNVPKRALLFIIFVNAYFVAMKFVTAKDCESDAAVLENMNIFQVKLNEATTNE